ncbi:MAG: tRNA pseudouridine(55) synthase TruB [Pseudomonadota bacterium]|jgi:tRNA pseudouridine55 synthase
MTVFAGRVRTVWRRVDGILLLDKPLGLTSNQALQIVRRLFRAEKAGHTGSLDPMATGVLPLCFGEATKVAGFLLDADKRYVATVALGQRTNTGDREGEVIASSPVPELNHALLVDALSRFLGETSQIPPMYSALKRDGEALYKIARRGETVEREPRAVRISAIDLVGWSAAEVIFDVRCSKGTYVRTLGEDLALALGTVGHLSALRRTDVGDAFTRYPVHTLDALEALAGREADLDGLLVAADVALGQWPSIQLGADDEGRFMHGQQIAVDAADGMVKVYGGSGRFLGLGQLRAGSVAPKRLFN